MRKPRFEVGDIVWERKETKQGKLKICPTCKGWNIPVSIPVIDVRKFTVKQIQVKFSKTESVIKYSDTYLPKDYIYTVQNWYNEEDLFSSKEAALLGQH